MSNRNHVTRVLRIVFGIFMIVVYLGMAYLLAINYFNYDDTSLWKTLRWAMAAILAVYGLYRCYRQVTGIDYYRTREELEAEELEEVSKPN